MVLSWVEPMKILLVLARKSWWIRHENLMNFPWINSQDFYGFLFSSDVHHRFSLQDFPTFDGHISPYRCAQNFDIFTFQSCWIITHILKAFSITFLTQFEKKNGHLFVGVSLVCLLTSFLFSNCSLVVQTSSTIWQFLWLNGCNTIKIDAWAVAQTVYAFIFVKEWRKQKKTAKIWK